ncbi:MAG TPA: beta-ketoacyl-[acyl-carrier-protein] synthase family protein [Candidatus Acidoferrales bacterium]|nr:beta-ketoacyl-[acyl-carrier-protein] synthase family protein [Candidatus Acidoferrales bacterium]
MSESRTNRRRVVITGLGVVSAIGIGKQAFWESLALGKSGIRKISTFDVSTYRCQVAGQITNFDPLDFMSAQLARRIDRFAQLGLAAASLAVADSEIKISQIEPGRAGAIVGTSLGTLSYAEEQFGLYHEKGLSRINPFFATSVIPSTCVTQIMTNLELKGPCLTVTTACASSTVAIGMACRSIRDAETDVMLAGGSEAPISPYVLATLGSLELLIPEDTELANRYRPFSRDACGFALGEGSGVLVLEELSHAIARDAPIYAEVVGFGWSSDAHHVMSFAPVPEQAARAIKLALEDADLEPEKIEYVNAHGTAVLDLDRSETEILKKVFGEHAYRIPVSTTKPFTGHTLGASGALGATACTLMLGHEYLHPTLNYTASDPLCDLDYIPNEGYRRKVDYMLVVSFGFGGYNAACILKRYLM